MIQASFICQSWGWELFELDVVQGGMRWQDVLYLGAAGAIRRDISAWGRAQGPTWGPGGSVSC